jgi:hypothetical protein
MKRKRKAPTPAEPPVLLMKPPCANAASLNERPPQYLWNGRIPLGEVTLLGGPTEVGKSTVATALAAAVTSGRELPGGPRLDMPRSVLWYGSEENASQRIRPRLRANGAVLARVYFPELDVQGRPLPRPRFPRDAHKVLEMAKSLDVGLLVFDPITSYCEDGSNPDHGTVARPVLECLREIATELNAACLPIKHPKKYVPGGSPLDQISGSKEWVNVPRSVLLCTPHPDDELRRCLVQLKGSNGAHKPRALVYRIMERDGLPSVLWEWEVSFTVAELLESAGSESERDTLADAKAILCDRLAQGEQKSKEILLFLQDAGIPVSTARKAKKLLKITSHTIGPVEARYHVWRAPEGGFPKGDS